MPTESAQDLNLKLGATIAVALLLRRHQHAA